MVGEAIAGLGAIKSAFDLARGLKDIDDAARRNAAVIDLQEKILAAQTEQMVVIERVKELEAKVASFDAWDSQKNRYELKDFGEGTYAFELKQADAAGEPIHRICPNCYEKRQRSILQFHGRNAYKQEMFVCQSCDAKFAFGHRQDPVSRSSYSPRSSGWT